MAFDDGSRRQFSTVKVISLCLFGCDNNVNRSMLLRQLILPLIALENCYTSEKLHIAKFCRLHQDLLLPAAIHPPMTADLVDAEIADINN